MTNANTGCSPLSRKRRGKLITAALVALACSAAGFVQQAAAANVKVAYALDYMFSKPELITKWYGNIKKEFEAAHPGDTLELVPIPGGYEDFMTKLSLLYNSPKTAPDIIHVMSVSIGQFADGGLLLPLDDKAKAASWWQDFPQPVQNEGSVDGTHYGVVVGINTYQLLFSRPLMEKAGLSADWTPKNWDDILTAARAIKKAVPDSWPIWLITGTAQGPASLGNGPGLLLTASSEPKIYDQKTKKWVVDSKGIREVLDFYKKAAADDLLAPSSQIMNPNATNNSATILPQGKTGIVFAGNWIPIDWNPQVCTPCWGEKEQETIGSTAVPTSNGQAPHTAATMDTQAAAIYKDTPNPDLAWAAVNIMTEKQQQLDLSAWGPAIPPTPSLSKDPVYLGYSLPRFQTSFADLTATATSMPSSPELPVWAYAFQMATQTMVLKPDTSIDDAVNAMRKYVVDQLGEDKVETLP